MENTCQVILKSGERRGQTCNRIITDRRNMVCNRHKNSDVLCTFIPPLIMSTVETYQDDTILTELNGYINLRISTPFFKTGKLDLVLISKIKPGAEHFTKASLAKEIVNELQWLINHDENSPFVDIINCRDLSRMAIRTIIYDRMYGLFKVETV